MWSYASIAQSNEVVQSLRPKDPSKVLMHICNDSKAYSPLVNIPAISERTLRQSVESGDFTLGTNIQVCLYIVKRLSSLYV